MEPLRIVFRLGVQLILIACLLVAVAGCGEQEKWIPLGADTVWEKSTNSEGFSEDPSLLALIQRVQAELDDHPALAGPATAVMLSWGPAIQGLREDHAMSPVVTPRMQTSMLRFLYAIEEATDDSELAGLADRMRTIIQSHEAIGQPADAVVTRLIRAAVAKAIVNDASLRLVPRERGHAAEGETLVIPAAAHDAGDLGTLWRTDLVLTATGGVPARVAIALLPRDQENLDPEVLVRRIESGQSLMLEDVLKTLFDFTGAAALRITCEAGSVAVTSRTYNLEGELGTPEARTFGQFIPALSDEDAVVSGDEGCLLLLAHDPSLAQGQRTNLILVNGGDRRIEAEVELYGGDGDLLGTVSRPLRAWEYRQLNRVFEQVTAAVVDDGYAVVRVTTAGGRVYALASVVDNLTGDPVAVVAVLRSPFEEISLLETQVIQAAARTSGLVDTDWRTDLVLHGLTGLVTTARVELLPRGQENTAPVSQLVQILNGQSLRYDDVLLTLFGTAGAGSIRVTPLGGAAGVSSRTYNVLDEGNAGGYPAGATLGQFMGPVGFTRSIAFGDEAWIPHLSHDPTLTTGSRANLGLVNNSIREIGVEVELFQGDGTRLGGFTTTLRQWENVQIARVFERVTNQRVEGGYAVVRTTDPAGTFAAHGSVVDNRTGDPITVDAVAIRSPTPSGLVASGDMMMQYFESGFGPRQVFELLRAGELAAYLDDLGAVFPDRVTRTTDGMVYNLGAGTVIGGALFASGKVGLEDASVTNGTRVSGMVSITFDETAVDGRAPLVDDLELGLDLAQVSGDHVAGTVTLGSSGLAKGVTSFGGSLSFDTSACEQYPIGGSISVTVDGEQRTISFTNRCDGSFETSIPSASYYSLSMSMNDCQGRRQGRPQVIHLLDEAGQLSVDPSAPADVNGRRRWAATGQVLSSQAKVRFAQKAGIGSAGERRVGSFQGLYHSYYGESGYYSGIYGYAVAANGCQSSYHHGRDDPDFEAATLWACYGPCGG